jgi:hypothetical protein
MACITDREVELFSKRNELIDTLSEERESTPDEESRIARHERDSKTTKLFHGKAEIENWRQQMDHSTGTRLRRKEQKEDLNSRCRSTRASSRSKPISPSIP